MSAEARAKPLDGIRVLDFTTFLSGPFATQLLGDLGAEVIKVEPEKGDGTRAIPPHFVGQDSVYFLSANRNKKSIALDLKTDEAREIIYRLVRDCDVVLENFRPGVTKRLGIDFETLKKHRSDLIYCSITGFGQDGPYSQKPAYDMIVQALGGTMSLTGEREGDPVRLGTPLGDLAAGLFAVIGTISAITEKQRNGKGAYLDVSMLDCQITMLSYLGAYFLHSGVVPGPQGREHDSIPTYRALKAKDGQYVVITANTQRMFEGVCRSVEREDLISDDRFLDGDLRLANEKELIYMLEQAFSRYESSTLLDRLEHYEVPCAPIQNVKAALEEDPQVNFRQMVLNVMHQTGKPVRLINHPIHFGEVSAPDSHSPPPLLGEHSTSILSELGYGDDDIQRLIDTRVVFVSP